MALFSTDGVAQANTTEGTTNNNSVNLSDGDIPKTDGKIDVYDLLVAIAGAIPSGKTGDSSRPRYSLLTTTKVFQYAGFYMDGDGNPQYDKSTDNVNNPDVSTTSTSNQPNRSIDKLTFYVMFRLPFINDSAYSKYYSDPLDDNHNYGSAGNENSWSYLANQVRVTNNLKRLNVRGEQIDNSGNHVDNSGNIITNYDNSNAFTFYNIDFNALYRNNSTVVNAIKNNHYPIYYFYTLNQENKYSNYVNTPHFPANIAGEGSYKGKKPSSVYQRRRVILYDFSYPINPFPVFLTNPSFIKRSPIFYDPTKLAYYILTMGPVNFTKYYVVLDNCQQFESSDWSLSDAVLTFETVNNQTTYYAEFSGVVNRKYDLINSVSKDGENIEVNNSGITFGFGVDMGGIYSPHYYYQIQFTIKIINSGASSFSLNYGNNSISIPMSTNAEDMISLLSNLLDIQPSVTVRINKKDIPISVINVQYTPNQKWDITIQRIKTKSVKYTGLENIYHNHIYTCNNSVQITPINENDRWTASQYASDWDDLNATFKTIFGGNDNWIAQALNVSNNDPKVAQVTMLFKAAIGTRGGPAFVLFQNNFKLLNQIKSPAFVDVLVNLYSWFLSNYYNNPKKNIGFDTSKMNIAEKCLFAAAAYNGISKLTAYKDTFNEIYKSHDYSRLLTLIPTIYPKGSAQESIRANMTNMLNAVKQVLYKNV